MNYYIVEFDYTFVDLFTIEIPSVFEGISMNLGTNHKSLPLIKLKTNTNKLPNCIPNHRRYLFLDSKILSIFKQFNFNNYQSFEISIENKGKKITSSHRLINILNVVKCIDRINSSLILEEEESDEDMNIIDIRFLQLDSTKIRTNSIFRLAGFETLLVFREDIVQAIEKSQCSGLTFRKANGYRL